MIHSGDVFDAREFDSHAVNILLFLCRSSIEKAKFECLLFAYVNYNSEFFPKAVYP